MAVSVREVKNVKVVRLEGKLVAGEPVDKLCKCVRELLASGTKEFAVDLSGVEHLDSCGIGAIADISFSAQDVGATCRFFGASPAVLTILKRVNLHRAIQLFPDESAALTKSPSAHIPDLVS